MPIIFDLLKKALDDVAVLVKHGVESLVGENFFARNFARSKQLNGFFVVVNLSAAQYHVQELHFFVE